MSTYRILSLLVLVFLFSCDQEKPPVIQEPGQLQLSFLSQSPSGSRTLDTDVSSVMVTIVDEESNEVYTREVIDLYRFDEAYLSAPISLNPGRYDLMEFFVLNQDNEVVYASPVSGSELASVVEEPLPISFRIGADETTKVVPEVIRTEDRPAEDFGYATFSFTVVDVFEFLLSVFVYDEESENFELTDADLALFVEDEKIHHQGLDAQTNGIALNSIDFEKIKLEITKEGYETYSGVFSMDSLKSHANQPLMIILDKSNEPLATKTAYGIGWGPSSIIFGSINSNGETEIISDLGFQTGIIAGYCQMTEEHYLFSYDYNHGNHALGIININSGQLDKALKPKMLWPYQMAPEENMLYGLGYDNLENQWIFGKMDLEGNETIISSLGFNPGIIAGYAAVHDGQYLFSHDNGGSGHALTFVSLANGTITKTLAPKKLMAYQMRPKGDILYSIGWSETNSFLFGKMDADGNETILTDLNIKGGLLPGYSQMQDGYYGFAYASLNGSADYLVIIDTETAEVVYNQKHSKLLPYQVTFGDISALVE